MKEIKTCIKFNSLEIDQIPKKIFKNIYITDEFIQVKEKRLQVNFGSDIKMWELRYEIQFIFGEQTFHLQYDERKKIVKVQLFLQKSKEAQVMNRLMTSETNKYFIELIISNGFKNGFFRKLKMLKREIKMDLNTQWFASRPPLYTPCREIIVFKDKTRELQLSDLFIEQPKLNFLMINKAEEKR